MTSSAESRIKGVVRYEDLRKKGMSKERAARIANSSAALRRREHINTGEEKE